MKAVIIYEESESAKKASALLERAEEATRWSMNPWRVELLNLPPFAQEALREAAEAHLIVLAVRHRATISSWLLTWLEAWAARRQVQEAALAVLEGGSGDTFSAKATPELLELAHRHGLNFILGDVSLAEAESVALREDLHERQVAVTATMAHILEQSPDHRYRDYGINE